MHSFHLKRWLKNAKLPLISPRCLPLPGMSTFGKVIEIHFHMIMVVTQLTFTGSNSTTEILEKGVKYVFIVNFEHIPHLFLVSLLLTLNK